MSANNSDSLISTPWATVDSYRLRNKGMVLMKSDVQVLENIKKGYCLVAAVAQATSRGGEDDIYSEISNIMTGINFLQTCFKITDDSIFQLCRCTQILW